MPRLYSHCQSEKLYTTKYLLLHAEDEAMLATISDAIAGEATSESQNLKITLSMLRQLAN